MDKKDIRQFLKKVWHFIWEDNSVWSWIVNIILAFLIIKFLVYPGLGFMFGTTHPVVAVVSGSMEHDGSFSNWWNSDCGQLSQGEIYDIFGVTEEEFLQYSFKNGFNKGDIMIVFGDSSPEVGDVIVFNANTPVDPIIHRIINMTEDGLDVHYTTKGDYNCGLNEFETSVPQDAIIGKAVLRVPLLGWIKVAFVGLLDLAGII